MLVLKVLLSKADFYELHMDFFFTNILQILKTE